MSRATTQNREGRPLPGVIVDPGGDLDLGAVGKEHPSHHVELPKLHRGGTLPASVVGLAPAAPSGCDEAGPHERPIDARAPRQRGDSLAGKGVADPDRSPLVVDASELQDPGFVRCGHLVGTPLRPVGPIGKGTEASTPVAGDPPMHGLAGHSVATGHLGYRSPVRQYLLHRVVALLDHADLHEHAPDLLSGAAVATRAGRAEVSTISRNCVAHQPGHLSHVRWSQRVQHQPDQHRRSPRGEVETMGSHRGENGESFVAASAPMLRREGSCKGPERYRRANAGFRGCTCGRRRGRTCGLAWSPWIFTRSNPLGSGGPAGTSTRSSARLRAGPTTSSSGSIARSPRSSPTPTTWPSRSSLGKTPSRAHCSRARATTRQSSPPRSSSISWPPT